MKKVIFILALIVGLIGYSIVGTEGRVEEIKRLAPDRLKEAGFKILRYEGYQRGSWETHGGKVWYHVAEKSNPNVRYRVYVTLWGDELQFTYGSPETVSNVQSSIQVNVKQP